MGKEGFSPSFNCFILFFPSPLIPSLPSSVSTDHPTTIITTAVHVPEFSLFLFFLTSQGGCFLRAAAGILGAGLSSAASWESPAEPRVLHALNKVRSHC